MLGQRCARRQTPQLLQLAQRLAQIVEFGPDILAQLGRHPAEVVAGLAQCGGSPPDGAGKSLGAQDNQPDHHEHQHFPPTDVGEHLAGVRAGCHRQRDVAAVADHLDRGGLPDRSTGARRRRTRRSLRPHRLPTLTTTSFSRIPPFSAGLPGLHVRDLRARTRSRCSPTGRSGPTSGARSCRP